MGRRGEMRICSPHSQRWSPATDLSTGDVVISDPLEDILRHGTATVYAHTHKEQHSAAEHIDAEQSFLSPSVTSIKKGPSILNV